MSKTLRSSCCACFRTTDVYSPADDCPLPYSVSSVTHSPMTENSVAYPATSNRSFIEGKSLSIDPNRSNIEIGTISTPANGGALHSDLNTLLSESKIIMQAEQISPFFSNNYDAGSQNLNLNSISSEAEMADILSEAIMAEIEIDDSNLDDFRYHSPKLSTEKSGRAKRVHFSSDEKILHSIPISDQKVDIDHNEKENIQNTIQSDDILGPEPETIKMLLQEKLSKFNFNVSTDIFQRFIGIYKGTSETTSANNNNNNNNNNNIDQNTTNIEANSFNTNTSMSKSYYDHPYLDKRLSLSALRSAGIVKKTIPIYEENILVNTPKSGTGSSNSNSSGSNCSSVPKYFHDSKAITKSDEATIPSTISSPSESDEGEEEGKYLSTDVASPSGYAFSPSAAHSLSQDFYYESTLIGDNKSIFKTATNINNNGTFTEASSHPPISPTTTSTPTTTTSNNNTTTTTLFNHKDISLSLSLSSQFDYYTSASLSDTDSIFAGISLSENDSVFTSISMSENDVVLNENQIKASNNNTSYNEKSLLEMKSDDLEADERSLALLSLSSPTSSDLESISLL